jgi:hypothetical protein
LGVLRAWAQSDTTFAADVRVVVAPGAGRARLADEKERLAAWLEASEKDKSAGDVIRDYVRALRLPEPERTFYCRYLSRGSRFRTEVFRDGSAGPSAVTRQIEAYTGERWESLAFPVDDSVPKPLLGMSVTAQSGSGLPRFEVARGQAMPIHFANAMGEKLSQRARQTSQVSWQEFLQVVMHPATTKELTLAHPVTGEEMPVLEMGTAPWKDRDTGLFRVRVWFDGKRGFSLARLECFDMVSDGTAHGMKALAAHVVDWSAPMALPNGTLFATKAACRQFVQSHEPVEGQPLENWPETRQELFVHHIEFSNVRVGEPMSDAQLAINPPAGTNVIDNTGGYRYFAGPAGEQLQKSALTLRQPESGGLVERRWSGWRTWLVALAVLGILGGVGVAIWRSRRVRR